MFFIGNNDAAVNRHHHRRSAHRCIITHDFFQAGINKSCRQRGFSSLEILIATILIGLLIAGGVYYANIGDKVDAVNMASIQTAAVVRFPEAIMTMYAQTNNLTGVSKNDLIGTRSVVRDKPIRWEVMRTGAARATRQEISIKFRFPNNAQASGFLDYLRIHRDNTMVKSSVAADNGRSAVVRYAISNV